MDKESNKIFALLADYFDMPEDKHRERMILAAKRKFISDGFSKITIQELCHELRISKKTFYKHFKSKEDLVMAVIAANIKLFFPEIKNIMNSDFEPEKKIKMHMDFLFNKLFKNISLKFMADVQAVMPEIWDAIDQFRGGVAESIGKTIAEAQKKGIYNRNIDSKILSKIIGLVVSKVIDPRSLYEAGLQLEDVPRTFFSLIQMGLKDR